MFGWPAAAALLFRHLSATHALIWTVLGGYLLLPVGVSVDLPAIPTIDKVLVPSLAAFVFYRFMLRKRVDLFPKRSPSRWLLLIFAFGPILTVMSNGDALYAGQRIMPGLSNYDAASVVLRHLVIIMPFALAWRALATVEAHRSILIALVMAGVMYAFPSMIEVRLSPQLHVWIYGFFPHDFIQQVRYGGYRPVVFLGHGLITALFFMSTFAAALFLWKSKTRILGVPSIALAGGLGALLVLCKSAGALILGVLALPGMVLLKPHRQLLAACGLAAMTLGYPLLRGADILPVDKFVEIASSISPERADSLNFRLYNEDMLLEKAQRRSLFGWGLWGRNRVYDAESGRDMSVTDGEWILVFGGFGWAGFIAQFGLLCAPVFLIWLRIGKKRHKPPPETAALTLIYALMLVDLVPNASLSPWTWMLAGSLFGYADNLRRSQRRKRRPMLDEPTPARKVLEEAA